MLMDRLGMSPVLKSLDRPHPVGRFSPNNRRLSWWAPLALALLSALAGATQAADQPHIVLIVADDVGWMDLASYAARVHEVDTSELFYETPTLDRLVAEGVAFTQFYADSEGAQSRAALMTGRWSARLGFTTSTPSSVTTYYNQGLAPPTGYLEQDVVRHRDRIKQQQKLLNARTLVALPSGQPQDGGRNEVTLAEALAGYESALLGKWFLGGHGSQGYQPADQGFRTLAYFDEMSSPYFRWRPLWSRDRLVFSRMRQKELMWGEPGAPTGQEYLTDDLTEQAIRYLDERAATPEAPFFLCFNHYAAHEPIEAKPNLIADFDAKGAKGAHGQNNPRYAAMLKSLDDSVGRVVEKLQSTGLAMNTVLIFLSDNGGVNWLPGGPTTNAPLKGCKATLFEGGVRVPMLVWAPGRKDLVAAGELCQRAAHVVDLFPTLCELAGAKVGHSIDGESFATLLREPSGDPGAYKRNEMFWHHPFNVAVPHPDDQLPLTPHSAVRVGNLKLIVDWHGRLSLYDIAADPTESTDLSQSQPEDVKRLFARLCEWLDKTVDERYMPRVNGQYQAAQDPRGYPFRDLRKEILGKPGFRQ